MNAAADNKIIVVIPAFNEGIVLKTIVDELALLKYIPVVVDDGSRNDLANLIDQKKAFVLRHRVNLGQGAALQTGIEFARRLNADYIVTMDADGQHDIASIPSLLEPIFSGETDVALGSRFLVKADTKVPAKRRLLLQLARIINFLLSGFWLSDAHNGFRALNKTAFEKIQLTENRMAHASEILFELKLRKLRFKEVPVRVVYTEYSMHKGQSAWDSIKILFDLILHKLFR